MKTIAIMPIKLNNERLPSKKTEFLGNKPLLQYELDSYLLTCLFNSIFVYCSNETIKQYLPKGVNFLKRQMFLDLPTSNFTQLF